MKYKFKYYLHDNANRFEAAEDLQDQGLPEGVAEAIAESRPFYEVTFNCEWDGETGKTEVLSVDL